MSKEHPIPEVELRETTAGKFSDAFVGQDRSQETRLEYRHVGAEPFGGSEFEEAGDLGKAVVVDEAALRQAVGTDSCEVHRTRVEKGHAQEPLVFEKLLVLPAVLVTPTPVRCGIEQRARNLSEHTPVDRRRLRRHLGGRGATQLSRSAQIIVLMDDLSPCG